MYQHVRLLQWIDGKQGTLHKIMVYHILIVNEQVIWEVLLELTSLHHHHHHHQGMGIRVL